MINGMTNGMINGDNTDGRHDIHSILGHLYGPWL